MNEAMRQTMWGFIFLLVDIRIISFDILPDWIGYLLVAFGCSKAFSLKAIRSFRHAQNTAIILLLIYIAVTIINISTGLSSAVDLNRPPGYSAAFYMTTASQTIHLLLVFWICSALHEYASGNGLSELSAKARGRWKGYLVCSTAILISISFIPNGDKSLALIVIPAAIISFILELLIINLLLNTAREAHKLEPSS